jgi:hypothetical protein
VEVTSHFQQSRIFGKFAVEVAEKPVFRKLAISMVGRSLPLSRHIGTNLSSGQPG